MLKEINWQNALAYMFNLISMFDQISMSKIKHVEC